MSYTTLSPTRRLISLYDLVNEFLSWRILVPLGLLAVFWVFPEIGKIIVSSISEAYLQVSTFVAATLALIYGIERFFKIDTAKILTQRPRLQVPFAAFLGALPGCGGAIVVVTQYISGHVGFGALIATLTATMGDAAFLLLAQEPKTGIAVFALGLGVGTLSGYILEKIHGPDFMRQQTEENSEETEASLVTERKQCLFRVVEPVWVVLMLPGIVFAIPLAMQLDPNNWFGPLAIYQPVTWIGFAGGMLSLVMWAALLTTEPGESSHHMNLGANPEDLVDKEHAPTLHSRVINDTNFVTVWVIAAFLVFEFAIYFTGANLHNWFSVIAPLTPLIAILVGFFPGCGPQIIVTTLYLSGIIPLAGLLGNAISNDGDALFPAIALAPKAAIVATLYTGIPALIVGYSVYFFHA